MLALWLDACGRAKCVRESSRISYENWKEKYGYGYRWATETTFSSVKSANGRGGYFTARKMFREIVRKFLFYNMILSMIMLKTLYYKDEIKRWGR